MDIYIEKVNLNKRRMGIKVNISKIESYDSHFCAYIRRMFSFVSSSVIRNAYHARDNM